MALQKCMLNLNQRLKELNPHGTLDFPCAGYSSYYTDKEENAVPWHWHEDYAADITLPQIVKTADIGERECLRCFRKTIRLSPIQYLIKYRIMQGAEMLLCEPESSISEIAISCGFDSPSNFARIFKRFYDCTPREYRKNSLQTAE